MIRVRDLEIGFGDRVLLRDLDFDVARGEVFAILGGSGSGKSTLMRHLIGLLEPRRGTVEIEGIGDPAQWEGEPRFGVLFQSGGLFGSLTLLENVLLPLEAWTQLPPEAASLVGRSKLRLVGLAGFEDFLPAQISGGMRKRAGIARALALEPPLLFLDEPSAGLDPIHAVELDELILALNRNLGTTLVVVTHELASIFAVAQRCILLDTEAGTIIARGDPRELRDASADPRVRRFFHRRPREEVQDGAPA